MINATYAMIAAYSMPPCLLLLKYFQRADHDIKSVLKGQMSRIILMIDAMQWLPRWPFQLHAACLLLNSSMVNDHFPWSMSKELNKSYDWWDASCHDCGTLSAVPAPPVGQRRWFLTQPLFHVSTFSWQPDLTMFGQKGNVCKYCFGKFLPLKPPPQVS